MMMTTLKYGLVLQVAAWLLVLPGTAQAQCGGGGPQGWWCGPPTCGGAGPQAPGCPQPPGYYYQQQRDRDAYYERRYYGRRYRDRDSCWQMSPYGNYVWVCR
jgi:hypothetical protein